MGHKTTGLGIILDRILHMLEQQDRACVLRQPVQQVSPDGFVLIANMPSNKPTPRQVFLDEPGSWSAILDRNEFLFMRRNPEDTQPSPPNG